MAEKTTEKKTKKTSKSPKPKVEKVAEPVQVFPCKGFVNAWGFIHLNEKASETFGSPRGKKTAVNVDLKEGSLIVTKA